MFLPRRHNLLNNTSLAKKKTFISLTSRSKSKERDTTHATINPDRDRSKERYVGNIGSETAVSLNNLQTEKAEKAAKREVYHCKNGKAHHIASLVLDY